MKTRRRPAAPPARLAPVPLVALLTLVALLAPAPAAAGEPPGTPRVAVEVDLATLSWADGAAPRVVQPPASGRPARLVVDAQQAGGGARRVLVVDARTLSGPTWSLEIGAAASGPRGATLQMWSVFPDGARYFSRAAVPAGSVPTRLVLPFRSSPAAPRPVALELEIEFAPGGGAVVLEGPVRVFDGIPGAATGAGVDPHATRTAALVGSILGTAVGLYGALLGWLATRPGRERAVAAGALAGGFFGLVLLGVAAFALVSGRPELARALGACGAVATVVFGGLWLVARRRVTDQELRRMTSLDAR